MTKKQEISKYNKPYPIVSLELDCYSLSRKKLISQILALIEEEIEYWKEKYEKRIKEVEE